MPIAVQDARVTLEVPAHLPFHLEQLKADAELVAMVRSIVADMVGGSVDVTFVAGADRGDAANDEPPPIPDKDSLAETNGESAEDDDPTSFIVEELGGEVISE